jgi:hypothetical protein
MTQPTALPVGYGVPQERARKVTPLRVPPTQAVDSPDDWSETPTIKNQIGQPELWRITGEEVKVFDLAISEDVKLYNDLLTICNKPETNKFIRDRKIESFQQTSNWKVIVHVCTIQFKKLLKTEK